MPMPIRAPRSFYVCVFMSAVFFLEGLSYASPLIHVCDRTPEVRDLLLQTTKKTCESILPSDLNSVKKIELNQQLKPSLKKIKEGDLSGLKNLNTLIIIGDLSVPTSEINGLVSLQALTIQGASFSIENNFIKELSSLLSFRLEGTAQETLPEDFFSGNKEILSIRLVNNNISELPQGLFAGLTKLKEVQVSEKNLKDLPEEFLSNLPALTNVMLRAEKHIPTLPSRLFENSNAIKELDVLADEEVEVPLLLPNDFFQPLKSFQRLSLSTKRLTLKSPLHTKALCGMENLETVSLSGEWVAGGDTNFFCSHPRLKNLSIESRKNNVLNVVLGEMPSLIGLSIQGVLVLDESSFDGAPNLKEARILGISSTQNQPFCGLSRLSALRISFLSGPLPESITCPNNIIESAHIRVDENLQIPQTIFNGANSIKKLVLKGGEMNGDQVFHADLKLENLQLFDVSWPDNARNVIAKLSSLKRLSINSTHLGPKTPEYFFGISHSLSSLRIEADYLSEIGENAFASLYELKTVSIYAPLKSVHDNVLADADGLTEILLCGTRLSQPDMISLVDQYGDKVKFSSSYNNRCLVKEE